MKSSQSLPIILLHKGNPKYLKYCLKQIKYSNPNSKIILLGDKTNKKYRFVEHHNIKVTKSCEEFANVYKHLSPNPHHYELFCFQRWFMIRDFMKKHKIEKCVHIDSDVMLFSDLTNEQEKFKDFDFTLANVSGHTSFINSVEALDKLCTFMIDMYSIPEKFKMLEDIYNDFKARNLPDGLSDMVLLVEYRKKYPDRVGEVCDIIENSTFDDNINFQYCNKNFILNKEKEYEMKNGFKNITFKDYQPYCNLVNGQEIKFNSLHFQGVAKPLMKEYFTLLHGEEKGLNEKFFDMIKNLKGVLNV